MKKVLFIFICILITGSNVFAQFGINTDGTNPDNSAMLDVKSTTKGLLMPSMTYAQRNLIANPANGLIVFCTDCGPDGSLSIYSSSNHIWKTFGPGVNSAPTAGIHISNISSIVWNWNAVPDADGYKWSTTNNYLTAIDMGTATSKTETGLVCGTLFTRYLWAYNSFGVSATVVLQQSTLGIVAAPTAGVQIPNYSIIIWNWNSVTGADGYKWSTTNNYASAIDMGLALSKTETGLACSTPFTRYVWAYTNVCGNSPPDTLTASTIACFVCGNSLTVVHLASGGVAPVDKSVPYETVDSIAGETPTKCWIARNLGASNQPTSVTDYSEAASGWYWQFNRKQGYKHDGTTRTPNTTWLTYISENFNFLPSNDPCTLELGNGWRIPTSTEWTNVDATTGGNWTNLNGPYNSPLKMHAAGRLNGVTGTAEYRGTNGYYWSSTSATTITSAYSLVFTATTSGVNLQGKVIGLTIRCIRD